MFPHVTLTPAQANAAQQRVIELFSHLLTEQNKLSNSIVPGATVVIDDQPHIAGMPYTGTPTQESMAGCAGQYLRLTQSGNALVHTATGPVWVDPDCIAPA